MLQRVDISEAAARVLRELLIEHGPLLFHQSGGCCDGSSPMCYPAQEFKVGQRDVYLGELCGCPFFIGGAQYEYWKHTHLTLDVVPGRGSGFSAETPKGVRFIIRSRVFTDDEHAQLLREGEPPRGERPAPRRTELV